MALSDEVTARISAERAIQLTNPNLSSATSVDATRLAKACADAESEFKVHVGQAFDLTDLDHVAAAVDLAILILMERGGAPTETGGRERTRVVDRLKALALIKGRNRIMPETAPVPTVIFPSERFEGSTLDPQSDTEDEA